MSKHYQNPTMEYGTPGDLQPTPKGVSVWKRNPTTTLKQQFLYEALNEILAYRMLDIETEAMFSQIISLEEVDPLATIIETQYKFEGAFHARAEQGPFQILQSKRTNRAVQLSLLGMGIEFSWERIVQNTPELQRVADVMFTRMKEANMLAALRAMATTELTRLTNLTGDGFFNLLMYVYRGMGMNEQDPRVRDRFITESVTFLRGGIKMAYTPAGIENVFGSPNGPTVVPMRIGVDSLLTSSMEEQIGVSEYMRFVNLYDRRDFSSASDRDIVVYDHKNQTRAHLSFSALAAKALKTSTKFTGKTWNKLDFFEKRPETRALYGRAKLLAANLPLESPEFVLLLQIASDSNAGTNKWKFATETVIDASNMQVSGETARNLKKGMGIWQMMHYEFARQNPNNATLKGGVDAFFDGIVDSGTRDSWSIQSVATFVGGFDVLDEAGINGLTESNVNLPIDLVVVRKDVRAQFGHMIVSNGERCLKVYYSKPIAGANADSTNMTKYASVSFGNAATADDDANRCLMVVRGAVYRYHIANGATNLDSLNPVAMAPNHKLDDVVPLTSVAAQRVTENTTVDAYVASAIPDEPAFVEGDDDILKMLAECAVRSAYAYLARDGREVVVCNPNAPAHLTAPLRNSC